MRFPSVPLHRARRTAACAGAAAVAAAIGAAGPGAVSAGSAQGRVAKPGVPPALKMIWGPVVLPNGQPAFPTYHRLGVQVFQIDLNWAQTAPTRPGDAENPSDPAYRWPSELSQVISAAARYGIRVCLLVQGTPPWANGGQGSGWAPTNANDYGQFLVAASRHYRSIRYWMIWGEPNRSGNFEPMPFDSPVGPRRYALVLDAAYHALKQVSPKNVVIGGDTWSFGTVDPADFVKWMRLPDGKPPPMDEYGHNPFSVRFPNLAEKPYFDGLRDLNDIDTLEAQLRQTYHRQVQLWLSEYTVSSDHTNRAFNFAVSRTQQARWLTAAYQLVDSVPYVTGLGWYDLLDEAPTVPGQLTNGLMTWNLQPKPAFYAYQHAR